MPRARTTPGEDITLWSVAMSWADTFTAACRFFNPEDRTIPVAAEAGSLALRRMSMRQRWPSGSESIRGICPWCCRILTGSPIRTSVSWRHDHFEAGDVCDDCRCCGGGDRYCPAPKRKLGIDFF